MTRDTPKIPTSSDYFELSEEQRDGARQTVARCAVDADDLQYLLDMLGLLPKPPEPTAAEIAQERKQKRLELNQKRKANAIAVERARITWLARNEH